MIGAVCAAVDAAPQRSGRPPLRGGIVVAVDRDPAGKATLLLFDVTGSLAAVAKTARDPAAEPALRAEHAALTAVLGRRPARVAACLPEPLLLDRVAGRLVLATTAVPGAPLTTRYYTPGHVRDPRLVGPDLDRAGRWLAVFQDDTRAGTVDVGAALRDWVEPVLVRYRALVGASTWEEDLFTAVADRLRGFAGVPVPVCARHGDYAIGNVLVTGDRATADRVTGVVDWERGSPAALPFDDVVKFVASYSAYLDRAAPPRRGRLPGHAGWAAARDTWRPVSGWPNLAGLMYGLYGDGWYPEAVRGYLRRHADRLGVPVELVLAWLPVFMAEQATALDNATYRAGYRAVLRAMHLRDTGAVAARVGAQP